MPEMSSLGLREVLLLAAGLVAAYLIVQLLRLTRPPKPSPPAAEPPSSQRAEPVAPRVDTSDIEFADHLAISAINLEVQRLRRESADMKAELDQLREEVRQLKATHNVSPIYSEAMTMAQRGELPAGIAARCGISLGEAELVAALANRQFGDEDGGESEESFR
jgi:hypothetical protein